MIAFSTNFDGKMKLQYMDVPKQERTLIMFLKWFSTFTNNERIWKVEALSSDYFRFYINVEEFACARMCNFFNTQIGVI
jgi:hypothetical protein